MTANQAPTRTREDIHEDICDTVVDFFYINDDAYRRITSLVDELIALGEARARAEAEAARGEPVYQVEKDDYYGWFDCKREEWLADEREPERKRILYTSAPNDRAETERLREENARLLAFAGTMLDEWEAHTSDFDGGFVQDSMEKFGLLDRVAYDPDVHGDVIDYADPGDDILVFSDLGKAAALASAPTQGGEG